MIDGLNPYPAMKYSGFPCLGCVPEHWDVRPLKHWLGVNQSVLPDDTDPDYVLEYLDVGSVGTGHLVASPERMSFRDAPSRARRIVRVGDTLVSTVRTYLKAVWHAEQAKAGLIASTGFAVLTPRRGTWSKFVSYVCQSQPFTDGVMASSVGVAYPAIAETRLGSLAIAVPPPEEQASIARFLDQATSHIDRYIRAREKVITLLEEQQRATINEAVSGQTDVETGRPYPSYSDSDLGWLRRVPSHWETRRSKRVFRPRVELARPNDVQLSATQAWGVIAQADFEERVGRKVVRISQHLDKRRHVEIDDFVISMRSFQGGLERAWTCGCIRSSYVVLRATTEISCDFFGFLFKSADYINALRSTADFIRDGQDLNFDNFCRVDLPFPPLDEQRRIGKALNKRLSAFSGAIEKSRQEMALLAEFRQRLVTDVVTGRLDVQQAASDLLTEESVTDRTDVSGSEVDQNSPSTQRGIAMEATS